MEVRVESAATEATEERPVIFYLGERRLQVEEVVDQWYSPSATYFRIRAEDGNSYILRHDRSALRDQWTLESFRRTWAS